MAGHSDHGPKSTNFKRRIMWRRGFETINYGGKMHSPFLRLSVKENLMIGFARRLSALSLFTPEASITSLHPFCKI